MQPGRDAPYPTPVIEFPDDGYPLKETSWPFISTFMVTETLRNKVISPENVPLDAHGLPTNAISPESVAPDSLGFVCVILTVAENVSVVRCQVPVIFGIRCCAEAVFPSSSA